jgi:hypothetical protein
MKMTLAKTWKECLKMWKDITTLSEYEDMSIIDAKESWMENNGYDYASSTDYCFFCDYTQEREVGCDSCPGRLVAPQFSCCNIAYHYEHKPKKFYQKLLKMDKKRRAK